MTTIKFLYILILIIIGQSLLAQTTTLHQYDNLNRLIQTEYPDGTIETFTYDEVGNRLSCIITGTAARVDLHFTAQALATSSLSTGESTDLSFTLGNDGNAAAAAQKTYFYLSTDTQYDAGDTEVACQYVSGIAAAGQADYTSSIQIPTIASGAYYLLLVADGDSIVDESDEDNNTVYIPITISDGGIANLVVQNAAVSPTTIAAGASANISFDIANTGTVDATATVFKVYLSDDLVWDANDSDLSSATQNIPMLSANNSDSFSGLLTMPANTLTGAYYLLFYADANDVLVESDEGDNILPIAITVSTDGTAAPMAAFTADLTDICVGQSIMFHDASTNNPTAWSWSFEGGEPATSSQANPSVTYHQAGTYSVSLTVSNGQGNNNVTSVGYVTVGSGSNGGNSGATGWAWALSAGAAGNDCAIASTINTSGEVYTTGMMYGNSGETLDFGNGVTATQSAFNSIFLVKHDTNGQALWAESIPFTNSTWIKDVERDDNGDVYICGFYRGNGTFGSTTISASSLAQSIFVAKYNNSGQFQWVLSSAMTNTDYNEVYSITSDGTNMYLTGLFKTSMTFGGLSLSGTKTDVFITKITPTGIVSWLKKAGGIENDSGYSIAYDGNHINVIGNFKETASFGGISKSSNGSSDIFVAQYDLNGNIQWVQAGGSIFGDIGQSITTNKSTGDIYITGRMSKSDILFGTSITTGTNAGEAFFAKFSNNGTPQWVKQTTASTSFNTLGYNITHDGIGNYFVEGFSNDILNFPGTTTMPSSSGIFLCILDENGDTQLVSHEPGSSPDYPSYGTDENGTIIRPGKFANTATIGNDVLMAVGTSDLFIAKYQSGNGNPTCPSFTASITVSGSTTLCSNQSVELTAPSGYSYEWTTGESTQSITVTQAGDYTITITDCSGCTAVSDPVQVSVGGEAEPLNFYTSNENCYNQDGVLGYLMPNRTQAVQVNWNGGNQSFQPNQNVELTDLSAGTYYTTITDYLGCSYEDVVVVNRTGNLPTVAFTSMADGLTVTFDNQSMDAANYVWYLGDGSTSTDVAPVHTYADYGTYNVCLSASNACGNHVVCESITVEISPLCFFVTNANDSGPGSLRAAIDCANSSSGADTIHFDFANIDPFVINLLSELPPLENDGTVIIGANTTTPQFRQSNSYVELNGSQLNSAEKGLQILANNIEVYGLYITEFPSIGITINGADNVKIGDETDGYGNIITGNGQDLSLNVRLRDGIRIEASTNVKISNNRIGTDKEGLADYPSNLNNEIGIYMVNCFNSNNSISFGNTISGNRNCGILVDESSMFTIAGNYIGTNQYNDTSMKNNNHGIRLWKCSDVTIGGSTPIERNVISNNKINGVRVHVNSTNISILGNYIGTTVDGTAALTNDSDGIHIDAISDIFIGGNTAAKGNLISGNTYNGIIIKNGAENVIVQNNKIGTDITGTQAIPNLYNGVMISNTSNNNIVGGTNPNEGNIIAFNIQHGIATETDAINNRFYQNSIFCNGQEGIDHDQNTKASPVINTMTPNTIVGTATAGDRIEIFEHDTNACMGCQGKTFLGTTIADSNGDWLISGVFTAGQNITATASDVNNTSEFSACTTGDISLPLEQLTFQATPQQQSIKLTWQSALEINLQHYNILRSTDGQHFEKIGQQVAQNKASASYTFTDKNVQAKQLYYYQLQIINQDGSSSKSSIQTAQIKAVESVVIYPNPTTGLVHLEGFSLDENVQIKVYDSLGQLVLEMTKSIDDVTIDMNEFNDGVYLFDIQQMGKPRLLEKVVLLR